MGLIIIGTLIVAAWCYYSEQAVALVYKYEVYDGLRNVIRKGTFAYLFSLGLCEHHFGQNSVILT